MAKQRNRVSIMVVLALFVGLVTLLLVSSVPVKAQQDSSGFPSITIESYTSGGITYEYAGGSIPVGATIDFRVWVDLYNVDPVRIGYGDGASDSFSFNGAFTHDFYHAYQTAGSYIAVAYMPTDSGTFEGGAPLTIGSGGGGGGNGGGGGGNMGQKTTFDVPAVVTDLGVMIGVIAVLVALVPVGSGVVPVQAISYSSTSDTVVLGDATTPQLLRSQETEKEEAGKSHAQECTNLRATYNDARKKADFARAQEEHSKELLAKSLQQVSPEVLKEYLKDKVKDAAAEIPIDVMMTLIGAEELEILAEICKKAATTLIADDNPSVLSELWENYHNYTAMHDEAKRLEDLANFWQNDFKSRCPEYFN
ncbi:MAG: hypothetical protein ABSA75_00080 [Candidatus Bathyarchaeia archaeon]